VVARVPPSVTIRVRLRWIRHGRTVVYAVAHAVTVRVMENVSASGGGAAGVVGAGVPVVAIAGRSGGATSLGAGVVGGAGVAIVAVRVMVRVAAPGGGAARVAGAGVPVVAIAGRSGGAASRGAGVVGGAGVAVVAGRGVVRVDAPGRGAARVV